jgi:hypothetical protein
MNDSLEMESAEDESRLEPAPEASGEGAALPGETPEETAKRLKREEKERKKAEREAAKV